MRKIKANEYWQSRALQFQSNSGRSMRVACRGSFEFLATRAFHLPSYLKLETNRSLTPCPLSFITDTAKVFSYLLLFRAGSGRSSAISPCNAKKKKKNRKEFTGSLLYDTEEDFSSRKFNIPYSKMAANKSFFCLHVNQPSSPGQHV